VKAYDCFAKTIYSDQSLPDIWRPAWFGAILIFIFGTILLIGLDMFAQRQYLKGQRVKRHERAATESLRSRTPQTPWLFVHGPRNHIRRIDHVESTERIRRNQRASYTLSVPRMKRMRTLALGRSGTGKSQVIHQLLDNLASESRRKRSLFTTRRRVPLKHFDPDEDIV